MTTVLPSVCNDVVLATDGLIVIFVLLTVVESNATGDAMLIV